MWPVLFEIPGLGARVTGYGLMLGLAFASTMWLSARRARAAGLDPEIVYDLGFWIFLPGLIGARLFYLAQYPEEFGSPLDLVAIWRGGIVLYGGIFGGAAGFALFWLRRRFPFRLTLDVIAPAIGLGIALGRIGCFLNGCCYGDRCDLPIAVSFPTESSAWWGQVRALADLGPGGELTPEIARETLRRHPELAKGSLPVHPAQIYSAIDGFALMGLLLAFHPIRRRDGETFALLLIAYPISRWLVELLRNDEGVFFAGMTISQTISAALLVVGAVYWAGLRRFAPPIEPRREGSGASNPGSVEGAG